MGRGTCRVISSISIASSAGERTGRGRIRSRINAAQRRASQFQKSSKNKLKPGARMKMASHQEIRRGDRFTKSPLTENQVSGTRTVWEVDRLFKAPPMPPHALLVDISDRNHQISVAISALQSARFFEPAPAARRFANILTYRSR